MSRRAIEIKTKLLLKKSAGYLLRAVTLLIAVSIAAFALVSVSPVDPVQQYVLAAGGVSAEQRAELEEYWGVNDPPVQRYVNWLASLLHGELGDSLIYRRPVADIVAERFLNSLALMGLSWVMSGVIGFVLGCIMGAKRGKLADRVLKKLCLVLSSLPTFWVGLIFLMVFSVQLGWFPVGFSTPIGALSSEVTVLQRLHHMILPAFTLSFVSFASIALHTREKLIAALESDYALFARARGESERSVIMRHGMRNIMLPAVTLQFASFSELFGGSVFVENVFSYQGLGSAVAEAGLNSDVPLLLAVTLVSALFVFAGNAVADAIYGIVDPRVREGADG